MTKRGMRGFAFGILVSCAVIAYFFYQIYQPSVDIKKEPLTEATVTKYLSEHQMVAVSEDNYNQLKAGARETSADKKSGDQSKDKAKKDNKQVYTTVINIKAGMTTKDVADQLLDNHIIKDKDPFYEYLDKHNLEKYMQLGKFKLSSDMSIAEIVKILTK
ncbi:YceG-like family protein [Scopulibacillus darangshiensis]|uniref:YceG-like family protein n=1 Tax=Scopulibacillus darangshiensis TaxID=442528 RepID=A0A4R2PA60_9BACL|nr:endolytic transglycosylase MltG [Scopulibacillus darangshiensis]TCP31134.1 YceG-like family protein [Scopulibacillus darangshiensis]